MEAMEALLEKQRQWLLQQNLRFVAQQQQLREQHQQQLDRLHQRMLELLKAVVDEEEEVSNGDGCAEQHLLADAHQVFDESPKRTAQIKPGELVGEGQEKLLEGSEVVAGEPVDVSDTRLEQASVDHLGKGTHKPSLGSCVVIPLVAVNVFPEVESKLMVLDDDVDNDSPPWIYTIRYQQGLGSLGFHYPDVCIVVFAETIELDFFKEFQKDGYQFAVAMPEKRNIHLLACWIPRNPKWKEANGFYSFVFDPGGCLFNPYKLLARLWGKNRTSCCDLSGSALIRQYTSALRARLSQEESSDTGHFG